MLGYDTITKLAGAGGGPLQCFYQQMSQERAGQRYAEIRHVVKQRAAWAIFLQYRFCFFCSALQQEKSTPAQYYIHV